MNYPDPYKRKESPFYLFTYTDPITHKRKKKSTKKRTKAEAKKYIYEYINKVSHGYSDLTFAEYSAPYFIWDECPRVERFKNEGKIIGERFCKASRKYLDKFLTGTALSKKKISEIRRGDISRFS